MKRGGPEIQDERIRKDVFPKDPLVCPNNPGLNPYNPIVGMGCFDHQSYEFSGGVKGFFKFFHK